MAELIDSWGSPIPSEVFKEYEGPCLNFIYNNTVVSNPGMGLISSWEYNVDGHILKLTQNADEIPDFMSVTPLSGWEGVTDLTLSAPDWGTTIITVCQVLLG